MLFERLVLISCQGLYLFREDSYGYHVEDRPINHISQQAFYWQFHEDNANDVDQDLFLIQLRNILL